MRVGLVGCVALVGYGLCWLVSKTEAGSPLSRWSWRHPDPQGLWLSGVAYGDGLYVAVGEIGTILASPDGQQWTLASQGQFPTLYAVNSAKGTSRLFVAVGESGAIVTSTNGFDWTVRVSGTTSTLLAVAYNPLNGYRWTAVGANGVNLTSNDGIQWAVRKNFTTQTLRTIASKNNGQLLVAGDNDTVFIGEGDNWTPLDMTSLIGPSDSLLPRSYQAAITFGTIVVLGGSLWDSRVNTSFVVYSSGTMWTATYVGTIGDPLGPRITGLTLGGRFVGVGPTWALSDYPGDVLVSTNGRDWVVQYSSENVMNGVCFGGRYVAVGAAGGIITSTNGLDWSRAVTHNMTSLRAIATGDNLCLAVGAPQRWNEPYGFANPSAFATTDGIKWHPTFTNEHGLWIEDMTQSRGLFVGVRGNSANQPNNDVLTTTNGLEWLASNLTNSPPLHGTGNGNGLFVVVGERGAIWVSTDGVRWSNRTVTLQRGDEGFTSVAYGNGLYVAAGNAVAVSTNGWDWSLQSLQLPAPVGRMLFADRVFVATAPGNASVGPRIVTSTNGLDWVVRYQNPNPSYSAAVGNVAHGNGIFLAFCGTLLWSTDAIQWQPCDSAITTAARNQFDAYNPPAVGFFRGRFIVAGPYGRILQSDDTIVPAFNPRRTSLGFRFDYLPKTGDPYRIQTSRDLRDWNTVYTAVGDGGTNMWIDFDATTIPSRFFRVVSP